MKDLNKIQEFFSKPLEENIVKAFDLQKGLNGMGYDVKVKYLDDFGKDVYEIYLNKPVDSDKIFFDAKKLGFPNVRIFDNMNEIDLNDLVLMKMRAAKDAVRGDSPASQGKRAAIGDDISRVSAEKIKFLKKERAQLMRDMEQEAEPEGGPIANKYGSKLNRIDKAIAKLSGRKEMTYDQAIAENKLLKQAKLSSAEYQKVKKLKDFNPNDYEWNPSESLYVKEKKSKFKKHGEMSGFDMRGIDEASEASKFKKGDKITYYGNKGVVNSAKYNPFAKDWDYTISYIEDGTRKGESGVRDKELKSSPINEAKFTDYSNNELAAYAKELSKQRADAASKGQRSIKKLKLLLVNLKNVLKNLKIYLVLN
jgi:hypothetical protein